MDEQKYQRWIKDIFDHSESSGDWRFSYEPINLTDDEVIDFISTALDNHTRDIDHYSDWQIGMGIDYIFNPSCSNYAHTMRDGPTSLDKRVKAILGIKNIYKLFNDRCLPVLGHLSQRGNELNNICYMIWDITPISYCENNSDKAKIIGAVVDVMEFSLTLQNIACIESGLHGLGHIKRYYAQAESVIEKYLKINKNIDQNIRLYAQAAKTGCIQ